MAQFETWLHSDLKHMVQVEDLSGLLFSADNGGNLIGVEVTDNGAPAVLSGNVKGFVILSNGTTEKINGNLQGNKATISLTTAVYNVPGPVSIVIKLDDTTIGACRGYVRKYISDTII